MDFFEPADIAIYIQGRGIVLKEKSLVAFDSLSGKIAAFGKEAEDMVKNPAEHIKIISPMKRGSIADYMAAVKLFQYLLKKAWGKKPLFAKPAIAVCVSKEITMVEKKALEDALYQTGAGKVFVADSSLKQLLEKIPECPEKWKNWKIFIEIAKDKPENYVTEQLSDLFHYAEENEISDEKVAELFHKIMAEHVS